jgi:hypothetical protein
VNRTHVLGLVVAEDGGCQTARDDWSPKSKLVWCFHRTPACCAQAVPRIERIVLEHQLTRLRDTTPPRSMMSVSDPRRARIRHLPP